ncbi:MAG: hypothetical protein P4L99_01790 [Chthoniobacter sp.]|nr:hypothetical protein [Chthoniobacter sp.]
MLSTHTDAKQIWRRLLWVGIYAVAMGLLEAICVIYLRRLLPGLIAGTGAHVAPLERLRIEVIREACTLVMLLSVAWLGGFNVRSRVACFFYAFGLWDIVYYVGLWWLAGWPGSWLQWDCLFLIPKPWYGPVLAPVLISAYFAVACVLIHRCEIRHAPLRLSFWTLMPQLLAGVVWYWSFVKDADQIRATGYVGVSYSWMLFAAGAAIAFGGLHLAMRSRPVKIAV